VFTAPYRLSAGLALPALAAILLAAAPITAAGQPDASDPPGGDRPYDHQSPELDRTEAHLSAAQIRGYWTPTARACMANPPHSGLHDIECLEPEAEHQDDVLKKTLAAKREHLSPRLRTALDKDQKTWLAALHGACRMGGHGMTAAAAGIWCGMDHTIRRRAAIEHM
jgi:uncharacterized protein YecT (DUF1311 family)